VPLAARLRREQDDPDRQNVSRSIPWRQRRCTQQMIAEKGAVASPARAGAPVPARRAGGFERVELAWAA
jgi:hypothetical protein